MSNNFIQHYSVETQMALEIRVEPLCDDMGLGFNALDRFHILCKYDMARYQDYVVHALAED